MTNYCNACGLCCRLFYINLSKTEYLSQKYQTIFQDFEFIDNYTLAKDCGANLLAKKADDSCIYLVNQHCSIHQTRPKVCQKFFCTSKSKKYNGMVKIIKDKR